MVSGSLRLPVQSLYPGPLSRASPKRADHVISLTRAFRGSQGTFSSLSPRLPISPFLSFDTVLLCPPETCGLFPCLPNAGITSMHHQAQQEHYCNKTVNLGKGSSVLDTKF